MITPADVELKHTIAANIRRIVEEKGMNINQLADMINQPKNTVYRVSRGDNLPHVDLIVAIADALLVSTDDLLRPARVPLYRKIG